MRLLIERMELRRDIQRLPIFGLGCAGGVIGLARAAPDRASAEPGSKVLFLVVELCALTFRKNDTSKSNIVATALFGDGAAGAILSTEGDGPEVGAAGEYTWPDSLDVMGWDVAEDGLKARFAKSIPTLVADDFRKLLDEFLAKQRHQARTRSTALPAIPAAPRFWTRWKTPWTSSAAISTESRGVLRDYGNMSAVTALFVAERMKLMRPADA